jgi:hypothetical protein
MKHSGAAGFPVIGKVKPLAAEVADGFHQRVGLNLGMVYSIGRNVKPRTLAKWKARS